MPQTIEKQSSPASTARVVGFTPGEGSQVTFFDLKGMLARDFASDWLLPPEMPTSTEQMVHSASILAGPLLVATTCTALLAVYF